MKQTVEPCLIDIQDKSGEYCSFWIKFTEKVRYDLNRAWLPATPIYNSTDDLNEALKEYKGGFAIPENFCPHLFFESEQDAILFLLKWS